VAFVTFNNYSVNFNFTGDFVLVLLKNQSMIKIPVLLAFIFVVSVILLSQPVLNNSSYYKMLYVTAFVICICNSITIAILLYLYHILTKKNKYWIYIKNIEKINNIGYFRYFRKYHDIFHPCL